MKRFTGLFLALLLALGPTLAAASVTTTGTGKVAAAGPPPGGLTFISHTTIELAAGAQTYSWTCGSCAAGDILIIQTTNNGPGIAWNIDGASSRNVPELGTPPYTDTSGNFNYDVYYTVLTANDISTHTITSNSNPLVGYYTQVAIYRGGSTVTFKSFATAAGSNTNTWAGFSPSGGSVGVIVMSSEYPYNIANVVSGAPATWTFDVQNDPVGSSPYFAGYVAHTTNYTNASTVFTGYGAGVGAQGGFILEVTP